MATSFTGQIQTNGEFVSVATETGVTFTSGKTYSMQIQNGAYLKLSDAIFQVNNSIFTYKAGTADLKIKTNYNACVLTILENEDD